MAGADHGIWSGSISNAWRCWTGPIPTSFGQPVAASRSQTDIKKGPFIVVSGHDLEDLRPAAGADRRQRRQCLHPLRDAPGPWLPGAATSHPQLAGNFGTAWQSQQKEFENIPAPVLFTTNCLMPPRPSYAGPGVYHLRRGLSTGCSHIAADETGTRTSPPLIRQALALGGYEHDHSHERHQRRPYADDRLCP